MKDPNRFYTYAYLREDGSPYYIGKGTGKRIYDSKGRPCKKPKDKSRIIFLKQNLTEEEAFKHEKYMIAVFGRKDLGTGILHNMTDGGDGCSGAIRSEETRRRMSEAKKGKYGGKNNPNYGKSPSDETRRKQSEAKKGKNHPNYGKSPSDETRRKQSEALKGQNNPNYGKKWWNDGNGNNKISVECPGEGWFPGLGKPPSTETKRKQSKAKIGMKWWNDGNGNTRFAEECPGKGWMLGRGKIKKTL